MYHIKEQRRKNIAGTITKEQKRNGCRLSSFSETQKNDYF